jgi:hypothetical protein
MYLFMAYYKVTGRLEVRHAGYRGMPSSYYYLSRSTRKLSYHDPKKSTAEWNDERHLAFQNNYQVQRHCRAAEPRRQHVLPVHCASTGPTVQHDTRPSGGRRSRPQPVYVVYSKHINTPCFIYRAAWEWMTRLRKSKFRTPNGVKKYESTGRNITSIYVLGYMENPRRIDLFVQRER